MCDMMLFPDTVEEFMEQYKIVDTEQVYTNGAELVPIFRMKQWFDHIEEVNKTNDDTISRQAAIANAISGRTREIDGEKWIRVSEVRESIKTLPSAERRGRWVKKYRGNFLCSKCGAWYRTTDDYGNIIDGEMTANYCESCGAKMDEDNATPYTECMVNLYTETKLRFVLDECIEDEKLIEKILKALDEVEE